MTIVIPDTPVSEAVNRLKVWRERWQCAQTPDARAHAQEAIDLWLDRYLESRAASQPAVPEPTVGIDLRTPVPV
jgi:hypothetical protein